MKLRCGLNQPLPPGASERGHALLDPRPASDEWAVFLAFSGGGTRAAALAYGVLEELARTTFTADGQVRRLLDEVDAISAVSGGSFTAAYYALHGDAIFRDFERLFLKKDIQAALMRRVSHPQHWWSLLSRRIGRSDVAAEFYDRHLFQGATFADLASRPHRPDLIINATDMVTGRPFIFTQHFFDLIGSDLPSFPLAGAVAASSAVPVMLSPLTLENHAERSVEAPALRGTRERALADGAPPDLTRHHFSYLDAKDRPFVHLVDGGVSDNLGLRGALDGGALNGGVAGLLNHLKQPQVKKIALVVVNAAAEHGRRWNRRRHPDVVDVVQAVAEQANHLANARTLADLRAELTRWCEQPMAATAAAMSATGMSARATGAPATDRAFYLTEVSFDQLADPEERRFFNELPTTFSLPPRTVDRLREVGGRLLRESASFRKLRAAFGAAG